MTTLDLANQLVALCREGKNEQAINDLFAENVVSIEANESMGPKFVEGKKAVMAKIKSFHDRVEAFHDQKISEPVIGGTYFSVSWMVDITFKGQGRSQMNEICVYNVINGKVVSEQFFY